ncbi:MAG: hypothetical protein ACYSUF_01815 [Planctomycetota bacterium]
MCAASAAVLLGGAAISHGQQWQPAALKIANGNGVTGTPSEGLRTFSFSLVELPNGSLQGHGVLHNQVPQAGVHFDITSYTVADDVLLMAGPITDIAGDSVPPQFFVGATFFFAVRDGGDGGQAIDEISLANAAPIPGLTIDEILFLICVMDPGCDPNDPIVIPPGILLPITAGHIKVFYENL